jgi:hypothetical protein
MADKNTAKTLEELMSLASKEIDVIAKRVQFEPAARAVVADIFRGLSAAAQKLTADFSQSIKSLPQKDRKILLSAWENSGVVNLANLLIPLLRLGDATDPCFLAHETSKILDSAASIAEIWEQKGLATILHGAALVFDLASQLCEQSAAEQAEENLNAMEAAVKRLEQKIDFIMDLPPGVAVPPVPKDETPTSLTALRKLLEVAKKFYKFEGSFEPTFRKDKQLIRIGPLATSTLPSPPVPILVTGLIDLGGMQNHDVVTITTKVLEPKPSPQYVIWRVKTFTGQQLSGIKHFQDFADLLEVPGDGVEILIAQSASSHNFDPAFLLTIPYQFLVETTVLPDFNVS